MDQNASAKRIVDRIYSAVTWFETINVGGFAKR
jgi:hypothetical protein